MELRACLFLSLVIFVKVTKPQSCKNEVQNEKCNEMDYSAYVQCIRKRIRRSTDYDDCDTCNDCNCDYCNSNECQPFCSSCCRATTCSTNSCCNRSCHSQCRTSRCRQKCRKSCSESTVINSSPQVVVPGATSLGNITTVITLNTALNNTNIIDVPIVLNNTNINKPTFESSMQHSGQWQQGTQQNCCNVVGHRQCYPQPYFPFMQCYHPKAYRCGSICGSHTMHMQSYNQQPYYIPQPSPRCFYQQQWPYVSCGSPQQRSCEGCYDHYSSGGSPPSSCSSGCYDEGYDLGWMYRQGPFYQRNYGFAPPSYLFGNSYGFPGYGFPFFYPGQGLDGYNYWPYGSEYGNNYTFPGFYFPNYSLGNYSWSNSREAENTTALQPKAKIEFSFDRKWRNSTVSRNHTSSNSTRMFT